MKKNINAVGLIQTIANKLRDKKLKNIVMVEKEIATLGEYLGTNQMQTILFVSIFDRTSSGINIDVDDISKYFECSSLEIVAHKKDFDTLLSNGLIEKVKKSNTAFSSFTNIYFRVPSVLFEAILCDKTLSESKKVIDEPDHFDLINQIGEWLDNREMENTSTDTLLALAKELEDTFLSCDFVLKSRQMLPNIADRILFYDICKDNYFENENSDLELTLDNLFDKSNKVLKEMKIFIREESPLQKCGLVDCWQDNNNKYKVVLSKTAYKLLLGEYADIKMKKEIGLDKFEFVKAVSDCICKRQRYSYNIHKLKNMVWELEMMNDSLPLVKQAMKLIRKQSDRILFYEMCNDSLYSWTCLESTLRDIYDKPPKIFEETIKWKNEEHPLQTLGLAEIGKESMFGDTKVELTEEGLEIFLQEDAEKFKKKEKTSDILKADSIRKKNLYFSPTLRKQLDFISSSIQPGAFEKLQERMKEKGLPYGVTAVFYGVPGTGKTETVYQLAKSSGRDIMQVDISEMKTCWYGESQKLVKGFFSRYERMCKKSNKIPILLFNEADAIFSKRMENISGSVDQTENAIQNIILEQMEKLKGILIATTNMERNLDPAFERRFLFKVKFEKPSIDTKKLIWQDKLPEITKEDASILASQYDFSGGEIDNIVRKATMNEVLTGDGYSLEYLHELCSEERISKKYGNIGFC